VEAGIYVFGEHLYDRRQHKVHGVLHGAGVGLGDLGLLGSEGCDGHAGMCYALKGFYKTNFGVYAFAFCNACYFLLSFASLVAAPPIYKPYCTIGTLVGALHGGVYHYPFIKVVLVFEVTDVAEHYRRWCIDDNLTANSVIPAHKTSNNEQQQNDAYKNEGDGSDGHVFLG
jgi:hypothetical protein